MEANIKPMNQFCLEILFFPVNILLFWRRHLFKAWNIRFCLHRTGSIEPALTRTGLHWGAWKGFTNHTGAYRCITVYLWVINQSTCRVWGHCLCCAHYCLHKNSPKWVQWRSGDGAWLDLTLSNYGQQIFSIFKPILHFYINVAALITFERHVPACQTPVSVSADSILTVLWFLPRNNLN